MIYEQFLTAVKFCCLLILSVFFLPVPVFCQSSDLHNRNRDAPAIEYNMLMISADYLSNTNILGMFSTTTRQPSYSSSLNLFSKWNVDLSVQGYYTDNSDDSLEHFTGELDLWMGYNLRITDNLTVYPSYAHYFYSENSNALKSIFSDNFQLDVDYYYRFINIGASAGYYLGKQHVFYATLRNSYQVELYHFPVRGSTFSIHPGVDVNLGSYEYLNQFYLDELREQPYFYAYLLSFPAIRRYVYHELRENPDLTYRMVLDQYLDEQAQDAFKLTSLSINLPVYWVWGNFGFNAGIYALIPFGQPEYLDDDIQFFVNFGLTYNILFR